MSAWIDAFLPTFGLILLGFALRRSLLRDESVWIGLETLTFWVLLPCLLAHSISTVRLSDVPVAGLAVAIWATLAGATAAALLLARALGHGPPATTSIVQGGIRFNNYMALAIGAGLYGPGGLALAGVSAGLIVPVAQTIVVMVFVVCGGRRTSRLAMVRQIATNPLLLGCLVGFGFATVGGMPAGLAPFVRSLGQASLALGLLCVGAGLTLAALREWPLTQAAVTLQKLVAVPLLTWGLATALGLDRLAVAMAVLTMAMPTATSSYVMARAMGGDARLMAAIVTLQHLAAVITLPLWTAVLS